MGHTHAGNEGDAVKHLVLASVLHQVAAAFDQVRCLDPFSGEGLFRGGRGVCLHISGHQKEWHAAQPLLPR